MSRLSACAPRGHGSQASWFDLERSAICPRRAFLGPARDGASSRKAGVERLIREAIVLHPEGMAEDGVPIPEPAGRVESVEVDA
jgi:hypothetical protein